MTVLDELHAVVLNDPNDKWRRVRWNPGTRTWSGVEARLVDLDPRSATPSDEQVEAATSLALTIIESGCERCREPEAGAHAIEPGLLGRPERVCMYLPDPLVVRSPVDGRKHDATCSCHLLDDGPAGNNEAIHAAGTPITAAEAVRKNWCVVCVGLAHRTRDAIRDELARALRREATEDEITRIEADRRAMVMLNGLRNAATDYLADHPASGASALDPRAGPALRSQIADLVHRRHGEPT